MAKLVVITSTIMYIWTLVVGVVVCVAIIFGDIIGDDIDDGTGSARRGWYIVDKHDLEVTTMAMHATCRKNFRVGRKDLVSKPTRAHTLPEKPQFHSQMRNNAA